MNLRRVVLALTVLMTVLRLVLAAKLGLGDDEAYYWEWSRRLALSYFDHPAMVAWLIHAGTFIFGDTPLGVRFFGLVANGVSGYFIWRLAKDLFSEQAAWYSLFLYVFAPIFTVGGILMVPDAPMAAAWMGYTWLLWQLWKAPAASWRMWLTAAFVLGFGLVSKYTTLLLAVSTIALFASDFGSRRKLLKNKFAEDFVLKFVVAMLVAAACCAPILIWNFQLDWPTLKFHLHDRQTGGGGANFNRWIQFWVSQLIILGPGLFAVCMVALVAAFRRRQEMRWRFIAFAAAPPLAIFTLQALFAEFKPHWPAPAYPLLFIGASQLYIEGFGLKSERTRAIVSKSVAAVVLIFFVLINVIFHVGAVVPIAHKLSTVFAPLQIQAQSRVRHGFGKTRGHFFAEPAFSIRRRSPKCPTKEQDLRASHFGEGQGLWPAWLLG